MNVYAILNKKTGKPLCENARLPFFYNRRTALQRLNDLGTSKYYLKKLYTNSGDFAILFQYGFKYKDELELKGRT